MHLLLLLLLQHHNHERERKKKSMNSSLQSALRICSSSFRRMMARSDLGGTSRKGGWMKSCWSLPIIARVRERARTPDSTLRSLRASHTVGIQAADGAKSYPPFLFFAREKSHAQGGRRLDLTRRRLQRQHRLLAYSFRRYQTPAKHR